jgi:hypothetical protein
MANSDLMTLASWLAGDFSNWEQAIANPPFFAHVRVCIRPLPQPLSPAGVWLYVEQAYDYEIHHPYRTAVLHLVEKEENLVIQNYRLLDPASYYGSARQPQRLQSLTVDQLEKLGGCDMLVQKTARQTFVGQVEPGKQCRVVRKGRETYLHSEFEVGADFFHSWDRGFDVETDKQVWGAIAGAFEFVKKACFAHELPQPIPSESLVR